MSACGSTKTISFNSESEHFSITKARKNKIELSKPDSLDRKYSATEQKTKQNPSEDYTLIYDVYIDLASRTDLEFTRIWVQPYDAMEVKVLRSDPLMIDQPFGPNESIIVQTQFRNAPAFSGRKTTLLGDPPPFKYDGDGLLEYRIDEQLNYAVITQIE